MSEWPTIRPRMTVAGHKRVSHTYPQADVQVGFSEQVGLESSVELKRPDLAL